MSKHTHRPQPSVEVTMNYNLTTPRIEAVCRTCHRPIWSRDNKVWKTIGR